MSEVIKNLAVFMVLAFIGITLINVLESWYDGVHWGYWVGMTAGMIYLNFTDA